MNEQKKTTRPIMPRRFPSDHHFVTMLVLESERCSALGAKWSRAKIPNPIAADTCFRNGWAYSLASAWLRCKLQGELEPELKLPTVREHLKFRSEQMGWNNSRMATELGMLRSHYSEFQKGKRELPIDAMKKAYALGIPAKVLLQ